MDITFRCWGLGAALTVVGAEPNGTNINQGCSATDLALLSRTVRDRGLDLGVAFDGDGDRMLAVDADGNAIDGDQIVTILALHFGVDIVAVTAMTNLGFHRLMADRGIRVITTDVGDRYVLEALKREGGTLGREQSGHIIWLRDHVTGDGLVAALLLCHAAHSRAPAGRGGHRHAARHRRRSRTSGSVARTAPEKIVLEVERVNRELGHTGEFSCVRPGRSRWFGYSRRPKPRRESERLCGTISTLVRRELGS